jgi:hypothetical protein
MPSLRSKIFYIVALGLLLLPSFASAGFLDNVACIKNPGGCDSVESVALAIAAFIKYSLGIIGAVALLFFIWGGVQWLISGGNSSRIERGKQIMINTSMGIVVAFGSYLLLSFFTNDILKVGSNYNVRADKCQLASPPGESWYCGDLKPNMVEGVHYIKNLCPTANVNYVCIKKNLSPAPLP